MPPTPLQTIVSADDRMRQRASGEDGLRLPFPLQPRGLTGSPGGTLVVTARRVQTGFTRFLGYWEKRNISCPEMDERRRGNRNQSENESQHHCDALSLPGIQRRSGCHLICPVGDEPAADGMFY